ncbi:hypothetical protein GOP47_0007629 [Adiantum capillus-veneris]|uniref:Uncharacterized protein n=1 Tax=Adiantum capillus-veneris TaxID=13818 RepID=A0A9D4V129_ADICA|nr:hypothetical protein GOP47_0007629 [Adiantum capillus-veneris]
MAALPIPPACPIPAPRRSSPLACSRHHAANPSPHSSNNGHPRSPFSHISSIFQRLIHTVPHSPNIYLSSNFAPLSHESPPTPCPHIEGTIPPSLNGVFLRNGPNPLHPQTSNYHYFDGDGMIHAVTINNGSAVHACRYIRTNRFVYEEAAKRPLFVRPIGELNGLKGIAKLLELLSRHITGIIDMSKGFGSANAGLVYFNNKVLAMSEDDKPHCLHLSSDGDIHTVGRFDFGGKLESSMSAHPKVDRMTNEMFTFSYNLFIPPYLRYFRVTCNGEKLKDIPITIREPTLVHDFAISKNYAIFYEHQIMFRLHNLVKGGSPIVIDEKKQPRVGILPRYDDNQSNMKWFECPPNFGTCMHFLNAWEEDDEVVMVGCVIQPLTLVFTDMGKIQSTLTKFRFNLKTGKRRSEKVSYANIDMGRINENYLGQKTRFVYLCTYGPWPKYSGVCKVDLEASSMSNPQGLINNQSFDSTSEPCIVARRTFGENCYGSEPFFVPNPSNSSLQEDDGYLVTYVHDEVKN